MYDTSLEIPLSEMSTQQFSEELAAKKSIPGGGGAAAYVGALAAALCSMAGNFTLGKPQYAEYEEDIKKILDETEEIRQNLILLVEEDARTFLPLAKAYSVPKDNPERKSLLENGTLMALQPPLTMMRETVRVVELLEAMQTRCSRLLISDIGSGAALAYGALQTAAINIFVNTQALEDREFAEHINNTTTGLLEAYLPRLEKVITQVSTSLQTPKDKA